MKVLLQRVTKVWVEVDGEVVGKIGYGLLVYLGVEKGDSDEKCRFLANKTAEYRIFPDENGKMNVSLRDIKGEVLVISQFTLAADTKSGRRPGFDPAASPRDAELLYQKFIGYLREMNIHTETGIFRAHMEISSTNKGPVTFLLQK